MYRLADCDKLPAESRDALRQAVTSMIDSLTVTDQMPPEALEQLQQGCQAGMDGIRQSSEAMGCPL